MAHIYYLFVSVAVLFSAVAEGNWGQGAPPPPPPHPEPTPETCRKPDKNGVATIVIAAGPINSFTIQFDTHRKLPITSTALHDSLNQKKVMERVNDFRVLDCPEILPFEMKCGSTFKFTPAQRATSGYFAWDRGHLVPSRPNQFEEEAMDDTFYCANMAPQDPFTNQNPWARVEALALNFFKKFPGFVVTGLCDAPNPDGVTREGYAVPACYWKLICYKEGGTGTTQVVGFIGDNTLTPKEDSVATEKRWADVIRPTSQSEIEKLTKPKYIEQAWKDAATYLLPGRNEPNAPDPKSCFAGKTISDKAFKDWNLPKPPPYVPHGGQGGGGRGSGGGAPAQGGRGRGGGRGSGRGNV